MWTWMGGGMSQETLVQHLVRTGRVTSPRVAAVLRSVDRGKFVAAFDGDGVEHAYMVSVMCAAGASVELSRV
jgi:protein-L-isoaspartate O-methyltransferase